MRRASTITLALCLCACLNHALVAQVSLRFGTNLEMARGGKSSSDSPYDDFEQVATLDDSTFVYRRSGIRHQYSNNQYRPLPSASLQVTVAWPVTPRLQILSGAGARFEAFSVEPSRGDGFTPVENGALDTFYTYPSRRTTNFSEQCLGSYGYNGRLQFRQVYLSLPIGLEYAAIPGFLWVNAGGHVEAPLYSSYPGQRGEYEFQEHNGRVSCQIRYEQFRNTSGRYIRNLQYGAHLGFRLAVAKNTSLTAAVAGQFTSVFVDHDLQGDADFTARSNPEANLYRRMTYRPQRLSVGLAWTIIGPRHAGVDL